MPDTSTTNTSEMTHLQGQYIDRPSVPYSGKPPAGYHVIRISNKQGHPLTQIDHAYVRKLLAEPILKLGAQVLFTFGFENRKCQCLLFAFELPLSAKADVDAIAFKLTNNYRLSLSHAVL